MSRADQSTGTERTALYIEDGGTAQDGRIAARLAPYIAWLAVRYDHEATRRCYREVAEHFLYWCDDDRGSAENRRARYCADGATSLRFSGPLVRDALERLAEHDRIRASTLPVDG